jgi:uncharacterized protein YfaS (alpha-2-macroglobulin family)
MKPSCNLRFRKSVFLIFCLTVASFCLAAKTRADLVTAHSTGTISRADAIQVQFSHPVVTNEQLHQPLDVAPIRFEPRIEGVAKWKTRRTLVFTPARWLPVNQTYKAILDLKAILTAPDRPVFIFEFTTRPQAFELSMEGFKSSDHQNLNRLTLSGSLRTADVAAGDNVKRILTARQGDSKLAVQWFHSHDQRLHRFTLSGIHKRGSITVLTLDWDGSPIEADQGFRTRIEVPASGPFTVLEARTVHTPERYVELLFSDPLDPDQHLDGLITLQSMGQRQVRFTIVDNRVRIYRTEGLWGEQTINVHTGIRNIRGDRLAVERTLSIRFEDLLPQVRFVGKRTILPTTRGLTIPIETANLKAVIVSAVHIPDSNVAQFLQVNTLEGGNELNRVGRPVMRRLIPLNFQQDQKNRWVRHGLDVQPLIEKHPRGLFRIELTFLPEHMVYDCPEHPMNADTSQVETDLPLDNNWDEEQQESFWDNWTGQEQYSWWQLYEARKNPCHPGYYSKFDDHSITAARNVLISDIGLIAKQGENEEIIVAAADLKSARPLRQVVLTLYDYQQRELTSGRTDADGMAVLRSEHKPFLLVARHGTADRVQYAYLKMDDGSALAVSHFDIAGQTVQKGLKGFIYGERGVWRPGDPIYLTFILQDDQDRLPADHPVIFELRDPRGKLADKLVAKTSVNGFYAFQTKTGSDAPTGNWTAKVKVGGAVFEKRIKVETVVPNRLKIHLDLGSENVLYSDGKKAGYLRGNLSSAWLHGAIARKLKADIKLSFTERPTRFPGFEAYDFDDPVRSFTSEQHPLFEGKLDAKGRVAFKEKFKLEDEAPGMLNAHFETRVFEPGGAFSIERHSLPFHPYARYVGLLTPKGDQARGMLLTDTDHTVHLAMLDDHGRPVPEGEVEIKIYKINWRWWWEKGKENFANFSSSEAYKVLKEDKVVIKNGKGQWQFQIKYPDWGRYMIRINDAGGRHYAGKIIYLDWPGWAGRGQKEIPGAAAVLSFSADKPAYNVGETVTLTIPASPGGRGLVSIENGSQVLSTAWIEGQSDRVRYSFKTTADMVPNVYAHVTFIQPHFQTVNDRPIRMYGVIPIGVEDPQTRLGPTIETAEEFVPEEPATVTVHEKNGRPMTYTVAVVDEGLLGLTRFRTPNPWHHFFKRETLGVKTWDLYDQVAGAFGGVLEQLLAIGGDADAGPAGQKKANRFPPVVRFAGPFQLAAGAHASHQIPMPRYVGQVRVMVVAGHQGAYGAAEKSVFVRKPLMVLGTLPRIISTGETVRLPVSVFALDEKIKSAAVSVAAQGPLNVVQETETRLDFAGPGDQLAFFQLQAGDRSGMARIDLKAQSGDITARQTIEIDVRIPSHPVVDVHGSTIKSGQSWESDIQFPGLAGTNRVTLEVSRIPPLNLGQRLNYLIRYPHGCAEQITSAAFPQLYLDQLLQLSPQRQVRIQTHVSAAIGRLAHFQKTDGGFGYWPGDEDVNAWATNYAGHFLVAAQNRGYLIPGQMLDSWRVFQRKRANEWQADEARSDLIQAYRLYTLALAGHPALGAMNRLREHPKLSTVALWRLAAAYELAGQEEAAEALVRNADVEVSPYRELSNTFGSDLRDKAMILEVLVLMGRHADAFPLIKEISSQLSSDRPLSTQTAAYALLAMARAAGMTNGGMSTERMDFDWTWNTGTTQTITSTHPVVQLPLEVGNASGGRMVLHNRSQGWLYPRLIVVGTPAPGSESAAKNGLKINIKYLTSDGEILNVSRLDQGTDFIAEIEIKHTGNHETYREVALTQMIPSGWEIHNLRLTSSEAEEGSDFNFQNIRDDGVYTYFNLKPQQSKTFQVHLTAAYEGRFYLPMISAEAMYDAAINARVPGRWVEVLRAGAVE